MTVFILGLWFSVWWDRSDGDVDASGFRIRIRLGFVQDPGNSAVPFWIWILGLGFMYIGFKVGFDGYGLGAPESLYGL